MPTDGFIVLGPRSVSSGPNIDHPFLTRAVSACRPASASRHVAVYSRQQARTHVYHFPLGTHGSLTVCRECSLKDPLPRTKITVVPPVL